MRFFICLFCLFITSFVYCQKIDYNRIILPSEIENIDFVEKLVRLAWENHPRNEIVEREVEKAEYAYKGAKFTPLEWLSFSLNYNEYTAGIVSSEADLNNPFWPRYNFNLRFPFHSFVSIPEEIKNKRQDLKIKQALVNEQKIIIRSEVLRRYQHYVTAEEILKIRIESVENAFSAYKIAEEKFKNGEILLSDFDGIYEIYNIRRIDKINAENNFYIAKYNLEELIGVKIEAIQ
jgi:outer membrane protein TolC